MPLFSYFFGGKYKVCARFVPAVLTSFPFVAIYILLVVEGMPAVSEKANKIVQEWLNPYAKIGFGMSIIYAWGFLIRLSSKWVEGVVFDGERNFPTTTLLLFSDSELSVAEKEMARSKFKAEFNIDVGSKDDELENPREVRNRIALAVKGVRDKLRKSEIVLQYNIIYGFVRNVTVGSAFALIPSFILLVVGYEKGMSSSLFAVGLSFSLIYSIIVACSKQLWSFSGNLYAKNLIREYVTLK